MWGVQCPCRHIGECHHYFAVYNYTWQYGPVLFHTYIMLYAVHGSVTWLPSFKLMNYPRMYSGQRQMQFLSHLEHKEIDAHEGRFPAFQKQAGHYASKEVLCDIWS